MSLATWKKEFYPKEAAEIARKGTDLQIVDHCIRKWEGLSPENREEHGLFRVDIDFADLCDTHSNTEFSISIKTCALCTKYYDDHATKAVDICVACPITKAVGAPCYDGYLKYATSGNPDLMLKTLRRTREFVILEAEEPFR